MKQQPILKCVPVAVYVVLVFVVGSLPTARFDLVERGDKIAHFVIFGGLQLVALRALSGLDPSEQSRKRALWAAMLKSTGFSSAVGASLEMWQGVLPHRSMEFLDWVADTLGAVLGAALALLWIRMRPTSSLLRFLRRPT